MMKTIFRAAACTLFTIVILAIAISLLATRFIGATLRNVSDENVTEFDVGNGYLFYRSGVWELPRSDLSRQIMANSPDWHDGWSFTSWVGYYDDWDPYHTAIVMKKSKPYHVALAELDRTSYMVSMWPLLILDLIIAVGWIIYLVVPRIVKQMARPPIMSGGIVRCRKCGYDLRATPRRCPECGTIPEYARAAAKRVTSHDLRAATQRLSGANSARKSTPGERPSRHPPGNSERQ